MRRICLLLIGALAFACLRAGPAAAQQTEARIALVIGNASYQSGALATAANDAGLVAQTLQAAGFDVVGARDLDQDSLRRAFRDFHQKAQQSGPNTVAFIYLSGYGLQLEGENYYVPVDARIANDTDVAAEAVRVSDFTRPLASPHLKATIVVMDAARQSPFSVAGRPLAGGLALVEPEAGMLFAFNSAPGTVGPPEQGAYGAYAQALAEMIREGGLPLPDIFDRVRLRVNDVTKGAEVPWHASNVTTQVVFFERASDAPPPQVPVKETAAIRAKPIRDFDERDAYSAALERDTLGAYLDFLSAYPDSPYAKRVHAIVAARREAIVWRRTRLVDTPQAYWSYLRRYSRGPHAGDAERRLAFLSAELEPPPSFAMVEYDVPPPEPDEIVYIERPVLMFDDPVYAFAPPPPPPVFFLPPLDPDFIVLPPPIMPVALFVLPIPIYRPVPLWCSPPAYVLAPPPNNVIYNNIHNTVVINNTTNTVQITNRAGETRTFTPATIAAATSPQQQQRQQQLLQQQQGPGARTRTPGGAAPLAALGPALPPSVAQKAATIKPASTQPAGAPGAQKPAAQPLGKPLPGMQPNQPLPLGAPATASRTPHGARGAVTPGTTAPGITTPPPKSGGPPQGTASRTPSGAPGTTAPRTAAPSNTVAPNTSAPTRRSQGPGGKPGSPPLSTAVAPSAVTPGAATPTSPPRDRRHDNQPPPGSTVNRTPPSVSPQVNKPRPPSSPPPNVVRPSPPQQPMVRRAPPPPQPQLPAMRSSPPPQQMQHAAPPPRPMPPPVAAARPAPPPPPPPRPAQGGGPKCPPGKSSANGGCR